jgi:ABC-type nitrate/sulfonate/bicarbonate transport system substrate-binding protein
LRIAELAPDYPGLGVVATRSRVASSGAAVAAYLGALDAARRWLRQAPRPEVEEELAAMGFGPGAAASVLATLPDDLRPSVAGLKTLAVLRSDQAMSLPGAPASQDLVDLESLSRSGETNT